MTEFVEIRRCRTVAEAEEQVLVLAAIGITCRIVRGEAAVGLYAPVTDAERARQELASYDREKTTEQRRTSFPPLSHGIEAAMVYCAALFFFFGAARRVASYRC